MNEPLFVGSRQLQVHDEAQGISFSTLVHYPTAVPSGPTALGPYTLDVSPDAPLAQGRFPLVVISHGGGGWHVLYRSISTHLAKHGYIVGLVEHPGNNRNDNSLADSHENLVNRPRHVRLAIDAVCADDAFGGAVLPDRIAAIGHSLGGYTALAVAGGVPWSKSGQLVDVTPDPRVRALVLLAPATAFYRAPEALRRVTVPILMLIAEHDPLTPRWHADVVLDGVPDRGRVTSRVIENAGHFSFLSPFPDYLKKARFPPANDPDGFDREAFHERLPDAVRSWLDEALAQAAEPPSSAGSRSA
jgi:predicted dienelactone hydrolase